MFSCPSRPKSFDVPLLTIEDLLIISAQGKAKARKILSAFRHDSRGKPQTVQVSMAIVEKNEGIPEVFSKDVDVNPSSHEEAKRLAHKSLLLSRDDRAVSSRSARSVPGSVPLYKSVDGKSVLVGAIGVSGDHPDRNEAIALAASKGFEAPEEIKAPEFSNKRPIEEIVETIVLPASPIVSTSPRPPLLPSLDLPPITPSASLSAESESSLPEIPSFEPIIREETELVSGTPQVSDLPPSPKLSGTPQVSALPPFPRVSGLTKMSALPPSPRVSGLTKMSASPKLSSSFQLPPSPKVQLSQLPTISSLNKL